MSEPKVRSLVGTEFLYSTEVETSSGATKPGARIVRHPVLKLTPRESSYLLG